MFWGDFCCPRYGPKSGEVRRELDAWPIGAGMRQKSDDFAVGVIADGTFEAEILLRPTNHSHTFLWLFLLKKCGFRLCRTVLRVKRAEMSIF